MLSSEMVAGAAKLYEVMVGRVSIDKQTGCWLWTGSVAGRGYARIWDKRFQKTRNGHKVMWELVNGSVPDGKQVLHRCDTKPCINPDHLFLGTAADNAHDRDSKKRSAVGEKVGSSKLTVTSVIAIRRLAGKRIPRKLIGRQFGVHHETINTIVRRESWKGV